MKSLVTLFTLFEYVISSSFSWTLLRGNSTPNMFGTVSGYTPDYFNGFPSSRYKATSTQVEDRNIMYGGWNTYNTTPTNKFTIRASDLWFSDKSVDSGNFKYLLFDPLDVRNMPNSCGRIPDDPIQPGMLYGSCSWPGSALGMNGILIFGGYHWETFSDGGVTADLWWFDNTTRLWAPISSIPGKACIVRPPTAVGYPAAREGHSCWHDDGKLYVFGGRGIEGTLSDLWSFNGTLWELISDAGINGTGNKTQPGARHYANSWKAANSKVYIQGGRDLAGDDYADFWRYANGKWKRLDKGPKNQLPTYPALPDEEGYPGARSGSATWVSGKDLFLFGGSVQNSSVRGDIWLWRKCSKTWYFVGGSADLNYAGSFSPPFAPPARGFPVQWTDQTDGTKFLFGGALGGLNSGSGSYNVGGVGALSDHWALNVTYQSDCPL
jgi:hypothetical protein